MPLPADAAADAATACHVAAARLAMLIAYAMLLYAQFFFFATLMPFSLPLPLSLICRRFSLIIDVIDGYFCHAFVVLPLL